MSPFLLFLVAILTPFVLTLTLFAPLYFGMLGAAYIVYATGAAVHPLATRLWDVFYIVDVYSQLLTYGRAHLTTVDLLHYTLPVIALPLIGGITGIWLTRKAAHKLMDLFHMTHAG